MTVLHAAVAWRGPLRNEAELLFWGEGPRLGSPSRSPRSRSTRRRADGHPFALPHARLREFLAAYAQATGAAAIATADTVVALDLPTAVGGPLSSEAVPPPDSGVSRPTRLVAWKVPCQKLAFEDGLAWLAGLPMGPESEELPRLGTDLRYLSRVAKFTLGLASRRKIIPALVGGADGPTEARWQAYLTSEEELEEGRFLRDVAPSSLSAVPAELRRGTKGSLVRALLDSGVDGLVRSWVALNPGAGERKVPEERWFEALSTRAPALVLAARDRSELVDGVRTWTGGNGEEPPAFRTCFRLDPPRPAEETTAPVSLLDVPPGNWRLQVFVQARDDPSLLVPGSSVLETDGPLTLHGRRLEDPGEWLLADLGRARRVYPALAGLLQRKRPASLPLGPSEAYQFLREGAPLLTECGFGILAPPWWGHNRLPLGFRMQVRPKEGSTGLFSLEGLVEYDLQVALGDRPIRPEELAAIAALKVPLVRFRGQWVEVSHDDVEAALRALKRGMQGQVLLRELLQAAIDGRMNDLPLQSIVPSTELAELWAALRGEANYAPVDLPRGLRTELRPYQARGFAWLAFLRKFGIGGCLADDMGLGKTIQTLTLLLHARETGARSGPSLLVCPTSVLENWRREAGRFTPSLRLHLHHGEDRPRGKRFAAAARKADIVLTSYALLWRDVDLLAGSSWDSVVLDEAQNIKNPLAKSSQAARELRARHRIALTGTPVENRLSELWSVMDFLNPGFLGPLATFRSRFSEPIERYSDAAATRSLQQLIGPIVLRRLKSDPAIAPDLPERIEMTSVCPLTPEQATLYEATVRDMMERIESSEGMERRALVLTTLTKLKQVCDHPALLLHDRSAIAGRSGKLERLEEMLEEALSEGDRALVFTQWREMGEMLRRRLGERFGTDTGFFHGGLTVPEREQLVRSFQGGEGPKILVLTLKAGGFGINLTAANRVFHFDRWWNPAVENQATDRSHRIGQRRTVLVHKLLVSGTLEERIDALLAQKSALSEAVLTKGEGALTELSTSALRDLFRLRTDAIEIVAPAQPAGWPAQAAPAGGS